MRETIKILTEKDFQINGVIETLHPRNKSPVIIFSHGLLDTMNTSYIKTLSEKFLKKGFAVARFDYTNSLGSSTGEIANITISQWMRDLKLIVEYVKRRPYCDDKRIILVGHCYGAMTVLLTESEEKISKATILISIPAKFTSTRITRLEPREMMKVRLKRYFHIAADGKRSELRINYSFFEDGMKHDLYRAARNLKVPVLFIHGLSDESVPYGDSEELYEKVNSRKELYLIEGMPHEIKGSKTINTIFEKSIEFLKKSRVF